MRSLLSALLDALARHQLRDELEAWQRAYDAEAEARERAEDRLRAIEQATAEHRERAKTWRWVN